MLPFPSLLSALLLRLDPDVSSQSDTGLKDGGLGDDKSRSLPTSTAAGGEESVAADSFN